jgi:hypothetical protein
MGWVVLRIALIYSIAEQDGEALSPVARAPRRSLVFTVAARTGAQTHGQC